MNDEPPQTDTLAISRESVIVFDLSDRTQIELTGADRAKFLHGFCTNDILRLQPGQGCEGFLTNIKGRVVGHVFVFATATSLWLDTVAGQETTIVSHLDRYLIREDVQLLDRTAEHGELFVSGPHAAQLLMLEDGLPLYGHIAREAFGQSLDIRRVDLLGQPGFLMSIPRGAVEPTRQSLLSVGCLAGSNELFQSLRIESGFPLYGIDITDDNLAQEVARTTQCISFTKGCYLGQEPIARLDAMGHTNRELRRLRFDSSLAPPRGTTLFDAEGQDEAGAITSAAPLAGAANEVVALGYLKSKFGKAGTQVRFVSNEETATGVVL